jgi:hypothetical protein
MNHRPIRASALLLTLAALSASLAAQGTPIGFEETFALSADRSKAVALLIPGSNDWFYYRCRERQLAGDLTAVRQLLVDWRRVHPDDQARLLEIENRQALLGFAADPGATFAFLQQRLGLLFDAVRTDAGAPPDLPTQLDPAGLDREVLWQKALAENDNSLAGLTTEALPWLADRNLDDAQLRQFLVMAGHATQGRPDLPRLPALVVRDLATADSSGFGSLDVHAQLRREALEECLRLRPQLLQDGRFVAACVQRMAPSADVELATDPAARAEYLARLWEFAQRLSPAFNALKAHVLHHFLQHDLTLGAPDRARFLAYLQLPRRRSYVNPEFTNRQDRSTWVELGDEIPTKLPAPGDPEALVRACLEQIFATEDSAAPYQPYLDNLWLQGVLAETKLLLGQGDAQRWHALLGSAEGSRELDQRVEIAFAPTMPRTYADHAKVVIELDTKNTPTLLVRVFAIDTLRWLQEKGTDVDVSIDLDGLVATHEVAIPCAEPAIRRVRRRLELPGLDQPGTFVIECVGNGLRSRALIRKGRLRGMERPMAAGHLFRVYDEVGAAVKDAAIWFGGRDYFANEAGEVLLPFTTEPGTHTAVLHQGPRASLAPFAHQAESYTLASRFHVDREALIAGARARLVVRPQLELAGRPVSLALLQKPVLTLVGTDIGGITTTDTVRNLKLADEQELVHEISVPGRLVSLTATLSGTVRDLRGTDVPLEGSPTTWQVNTNDASALTHGLQLVRATSGFALELRGKNGEPKGNRAATVIVYVRGFHQGRSSRLRSDSRGRIELGALPDVAAIHVQCDAGDFWLAPPTPRCALPNKLHGLAGETLRLPYQGQASAPLREEFSLLDHNRDAFSHLAIADGFLELRGLAPGDYHLHLHRQGKTIPVAVTQGTRNGGWLLGAVRRLEAAGNQPLHLRQLQIAGDQLTIRLANPTPSTRVTVVATRFDAPFHLMDGLVPREQRTPGELFERRDQNQFTAGLPLDGEYRYVLERRFAARFPGNMLRRPSLLLNPWRIELTNSVSIWSSEGASFGASGSPAPKSTAVSIGGDRRPSRHPGNAGNLDFLPRPSVTLANLTPDAGGIVRVELADLGDGQIVHVLALDGGQAVYDTMLRDEPPLQPRSRQLAQALDGTQHFAETKRIEFVAAGGTVSLGDGLDSKVETFDSLAAVHSLMMAIRHDESLAKFEFVLRWPQLTPAQRQELYSQFACHELHFFLYHKDRTFFDEVCKPFLQCKLDRTFLDHWLLGSDLTGFTEPWAFAQLHLVERILLAQRLGDAERLAIARGLREALELRPVDPQVMERLLELSVAERFYFKRSVENAPAQMEPAKADDHDESVAAPKRRQLERGAEKEAKAKKDAADAKEVADEPGADTGARHSGFVAHDQLRADIQSRGAVAQLYRAVESTKLLVEHNYWHRRIDQTTPDIVAPNQFWVDYATAAAGLPFVSAAIVQTGGSFLETMMALSVLDLPFEAGKHEVTVDGDKRTLRAATPLLLVRKETTKTEKAQDLPPLLLGENFFRLDDRYRHENGERRDAFVTDEFLVDVAYGCQVVITNPTSSKRTTEVLLQVPAGAIPVQKGFWTKGIAVVLEPYATQSIEYAFYFPAAGSFAHYPAHAAEKGRLAANAEPRLLNVVVSPTRVDTTSWEHVSQQGTPAEVMAFLDTHNVQRLDLAKVAWRMKDRAFFTAMLGKLRARHVYDDTLWSYSILHRDADAAREYLRHAEKFLQQCGMAIASPLVTIDPVERKRYQHLELDPLVNQRAHQLGSQRQLGNQDLAQQYAGLMNLLGYTPKLGSGDWLAVTYYLLLQDRIEDALGAFAKIDPTQVAEKIQFDYLAAYLCFFTNDVGKARGIAERYRDHPVVHWQKRFADVRNQLDEAEGKATATTGEPNADVLAATAPSLELSLEAKNVTVRTKNLTQCEIRYYALDVEFAFSAMPFAGQNGTTAAFVQPNLREAKDLPKGGELTFELPAQFHQKNVLVEVRGGGLLRAQTFFANALAVRWLETYGQVAVTEPGTNAPLPKTYVKVFAKLPSGEVRFHKDGYTDLRGRFDYASLSDDPNAGAVRYAVLVLSEQRGAVLREVAPPAK